VTNRLLIALAVLCMALPAHAEDTSNGLTLGTSETLSLGDLRDMGLCINQIQQQTMNIYMEVTRKAVPSSAEAKIEDLKVITKGSLDANARYEPVRPEWLTYYIGTLEPIIHLFKVDLDSTRSGASKVMVPTSTVEEFHKLLNNFDIELTKINKCLDVIHDKMSDPHGNVAIAQEAVKLYDVTLEMEKARHYAFNAVKLANQRGETREAVPIK